MSGAAATAAATLVVSIRSGMAAPELLVRRRQLAQAGHRGQQQDHQRDRQRAQEDRQGGVRSPGAARDAAEQGADRDGAEDEDPAAGYHTAQQMLRGRRLPDA